MLSRALIVLALLLVSGLTSSIRAAEKDENVDVTQLGDLSGFKALAVAAQKALNDDDIATAKGKMKELETSWDNNEGTLKQRSARAWTFIDKKIDAALFALRAAKPNADKCKTALDALVSAFPEDAKKK